MSLINSLEKNFYMGIDESNHGRFPEIFVAAFSRFPTDVLNKYPLSKIRNHKKLFGHFSKRDYTFLSIEENDFERVSKRDIHGIIISSLLLNELPPSFETLEIYIDGIISPEKKIRTKEIIYEHMNIEKSRLTILSGPQLDRTYKLVNLADEMAHYIFRKSSPNQQALSKHRRYLLS